MCCSVGLGGMRAMWRSWRDFQLGRALTSSWTFALATEGWLVILHESLSILGRRFVQNDKLASLVATNPR